MRECTIHPIRFVRTCDEALPLIACGKWKADGLFESLRAALEEDGISWDRVLGYASDGENLMQGQNNSFLTQMKEVVPDIFVLKCFCHSFHLVAEHACASLSKSAEQLIHNVYNFFKNVPNRLKSLRRVPSLKGKADVKASGVLASKLPKRLSQCCGIQTIDRQ